MILKKNLANPTPSTTEGSTHRTQTAEESANKDEWTGKSKSLQYLATSAVAQFFENMNN